MSVMATFSKVLWVVLVVYILLTLFFSCTHFTELERSLSNSLLNLEASNAELEKFKLERAQLHAQMESVSNGDKQKS